MMGSNEESARRLLDLHLGSQLDVPPLQATPTVFQSALSSATHSIHTDFTSGARQLATTSLQYLAHLTLLASSITTTRTEIWILIVHAAQQLSRARPSMSAAIKSCLLCALARVEKAWDTEKLHYSPHAVELAKIAGDVFEQIIREREEAGRELSQHFTLWLYNYCSESCSKKSIHILTLSSSSTLLAALLHTLSHSSIHINLTILESRPRCEGADFALQIYTTNPHPLRLSLNVVPDCAVGTAVSDVDIMLLGADRISARGDVKNKIGSLAAVLCAKHAARQDSREVKVVVVSDTDKIAATGCEIEPELENHPSSELSKAWSAETREGLEGREGVGISGEWFEWVPARYVNVYVTEEGVLGRGQVEKKARELEELEGLVCEERGGAWVS